MKSNVGRLSVLIYTGISVIVVCLFLAGTLTGKYTLVERIGGAGWVFLLSMIILMPVVTQTVKKRVDKSGN